MTENTANNANSVVITVGGSLLVPDEIDTDFINTFTELIQDEVSNGTSFFCIAGGGKVCRRYQGALKELSPGVDNETLDWLGIHVTRLNAQLLRMAFGELAHSDIILDPTEAEGIEAPVIIGAGWKPGWSTDYDAVHIAETIGADSVINLSNIPCVYSADPKVDPDAEPLESLTWDEYLDIIPSDWSPGLSTPFDTVASRLAKEHGIEVAIVDGADLDALRAYLRTKEGAGTIIHS